MTTLVGRIMLCKEKPIVRLCQACWTAVRHYSWPVDEKLPRIVVPHKMMQKITKMKQKNAEKRHSLKRTYKGPLVISCKRPEFNHYKGQTYSNFNPQHLASGAWKHPKSRSDYFTINAFMSNPALNLEDVGDVSFADMGLNDHLIEALDRKAVHRPTNIQALAIPHMMDGENVMCVAETGSGKTLAYLLPILHKIYQFNVKYGRNVIENSPKGVILAPSIELADQIYDVAAQFTQQTDIHSQVLCGGRGSQRILKSQPKTSIDLLVTTPGVFSKVLTNRIYDMSQLQHIVFDEADTLFDDSFCDLTTRIIQKLKVTSEKLVVDNDVTSVGTQMALVGATIPRDLQNILEGIIPYDTITKVTTSSVHRLMPHVPQKFMRLTSADKPEALVSVAKSNQNRKLPTLIFCNSNKTVSFVHFLLRENGVENTYISATLPRPLREGRFEQFQNGEFDILVSTDLTSRGLDTIRAQHVINYDFPDFMSDYIHRVGRVGRVSSSGSGSVLSFVTRKWEVDLLWQIESSARRMTELHNVNANIKRKLVGRVMEREAIASEAAS